MTDDDLRSVTDVIFTADGLFKSHEIRVQRAEGTHRGLTRCHIECLTCGVTIAEATPWPSARLRDHTWPMVALAIGEP